MSDEKQKLFKNLFIFRSLSAAGDEIWRISYPIWIAALYGSAEILGQLVSASAACTLLGLLFSTPLISRYKSSTICMVADAIDATLMLALATIILYGPNDWNLPLVFFATCVNGFTYNLNFTASETLFAKIISKNMALATHRANFFAFNVGATIGTLVGPFLYKATGLLGASGFNFFSYLGQIIALWKIGPLENAPLKTASPRLFINISAGWSSDAIKYMTICASLTRLLIVGFLPFVPFSLTQMNASTFSVSLVVGAYAVGTILGSYKSSYTNFVASRGLFFEIIILTIAGMCTVVMAIIKTPPLYVGCALLVAGYTMAQFTIKIRTLRQISVPAEAISDVVSAQALLSRLIMPASGTGFALLMSKVSSPYLATLILSPIIGASVISGYLMTHKFSKSGSS